MSSSTSLAILSAILMALILTPARVVAEVPAAGETPAPLTVASATASATRQISGPGYTPGMSMSDYLKEARTLADAGENAQALERYIWFHNHCLEVEESMYGVRLSFALSDWEELGEAYPPALEAMKKVRDEKTALINSGKGNAELVNDVFALNDHLGAQNQSVALFKKIDADNPTLAKAAWLHARHTLVKADELALAGKYTGDLKAAFDEVLKGYQDSLTSLDKGAASLKSAIDDNFAEDVCLLLKIATGTGKTKEGEEIQKKALTVLDSDAIKNGLRTKN